MTITNRVKALRERLAGDKPGKRLTQKELADRSGLRRTEIVRLEGVGNKGSSANIRRSLARGFGLGLEDCNSYLEGAMTLDAALAAIERRKNAPAGADEEDPVPERASAVRFARDAGYPQAVLDRAYRARKGPRLSHDQWLDRLRGWKTEVQPDESEPAEIHTRTITAGLGSVIQLLGALLFTLPSLVGLGMCTFAGSNSATLGMYGLASLPGLLMGGFTWVWGARLARRFECGACGNPVESKNVRLCPTCKVDLR